MVSPRLNASGRMYAKLRLVVGVGAAPTTCWSSLGCLRCFDGGMLRATRKPWGMYCCEIAKVIDRPRGNMCVLQGQMFTQIGLTDVK
ncbi:hypothetical protein F5I97DRAFT_1835888, partial [Phlebopus sp. FC_14]